LKQVDLEPGAYRVKDRKEPVLLRGWWVGVLAFVFIVLFGAFVMKPLFGVVQPWLHSVLFGN